VQESFKPIQLRVAEQSRSDATADHIASLSLDPSTTVSAPSWRKLKELPLPTYSGDFVEWRHFWCRFENAMKKSFTDNTRSTSRCSPSSPSLLHLGRSRWVRCERIVHRHRWSETELQHDWEIRGWHHKTVTHRSSGTLNVQ